MERTNDTRDELVDLGIASIETQGPPGPAWEIQTPDLQHGIQDR